MKCEMKLQTHSQTVMVYPLMFWNGQVFYPTLNCVWNYISVLPLQLIHVSKNVSWGCPWMDSTHVLAQEAEGSNERFMIIHKNGIAPVKSLKI